MMIYCEQCRDFHEENDLCPKYKEQLKQHPEWFNEMVQTVVSANATSPTVQRYGAAVKEHLVAYSGVDNQTGQNLTRSLKSISEQKTNPNYEYQNLKQQAGFAAEVQETARANAERAINGDQTRVVRTDDIGRVNDPLYDLVEIDAAGNVIDGSGVQMKFVGATAEECWKKAISPKFQKYVDGNARIGVPSDYYDKMIDAANEQIETLNKQYQSLLSNGDYSKAESVKQRIEHCEKTKGLLQKSQVSSKEAMYAVEHPERYTAKEILKNANQAGLQGAQYGALIGGGISIVRNVVQLKNGEIKAEVAIKNVAVDAAKGAVGGYVVGAGGAVLKGVMQNSSSNAIRALSETQFPSGAVGLAYGITKSAITNFIRYKNGELSKSEMAKSFAKDAVKGSLITCSLAMISFPAGIPGAIAAMGVAIYLDAVCTNILDEVFGEGLYEQILNASGNITAIAQNAVEQLKDFSVNVRMTEQYNRKSERKLEEIRNKRDSIEIEKEKSKRLIEEL